PNHRNRTTTATYTATITHSQVSVSIGGFLAHIGLGIFGGEAEDLRGHVSNVHVFFHRHPNLVSAPEEYPRDSVILLLDTDHFVCHHDHVFRDLHNGLLHSCPPVNRFLIIVSGVAPSRCGTPYLFPFVMQMINASPSPAHGPF